MSFKSSLTVKGRTAIPAYVVFLIVVMAWCPLYAIDLPVGEKRSPRPPREQDHEFAPGEILIKFKHERGVEFMRSSILPTTVAALNAKYGVRTPKPVFEGLVHSMRQRGMDFNAHTEGVRKKFPRRSVRAPERASVPDLSLWYRLRLAEDADVPAVVEEYRKDPNVEEAQPNYICYVQGIPPNDPYYSSSRSWGQAYDDLWGLKKIQ